jgi:transposase-like protein
VPRPDFPRTIIEFQHRFPDDDACRAYLFDSRWPVGFRCPRCGSGTATPLPRRLLWQCSACRYQVSVTAGSVLHKTRTPLHLWFWAVYLVTTATPGISALQLQRQLGLRRYETAWMMLHKLRRAMVNPEREPLTRVVERVAIELDRRRSPAERAAISQDQADTLKGVIHAMLDGIGLSGEQRQRALAIAATELRRVAGEEPLMTGVVLDVAPHDGPIVPLTRSPRLTRGKRW